MLGKCPIKLRQRPDMTIAVDWGVKHQIKQTKTNSKWRMSSIKFGKSLTKFMIPIAELSKTSFAY